MSGVGADFFNKDFNLFDAIRRADDGDTNAMYSVIAYIAMEDEGEQDLLEKKMEYVNRLIESGDKAALIMKGDCYRDGKGVAKDAEKAMALYNRAADAGILFGYECIGQMYFFGDGVDVDYEKAYEFLTKHADSLSPESTFLIGEMYRKGLFLPKDDKKAFDMYASIIKKNNTWMDDYYPLAAYMLAKYSAENTNMGYDLKWAYDAIEYVRKNVQKPHILSDGEYLTIDMIEELWQKILREKMRREHF